MDSLLSQLGLYDFWGTLFPGLVGITILIPILPDRMTQENEQVFWHSLIIYIIASYLLGILLHETGHWAQEKILYKKLKKNGEPCDNFLLDNSELKTDEKEVYLELYVKWAQSKHLPLTPTRSTCRLFFNYCDYYIQSKKNHAQASRMQSLYGMSRSLFVYFFIMLPVFFYKLYFVAAFMSFVVSLIFLNRAYRFNLIRLKVVMRTYCIELASSQ